MTKPAILVISSHVVRGTVGNRAAVFALEMLGFPVWAVPTVTLPWHPGHGPATRIIPPADAFAQMLADLERAPWLGEVGGILTGYLGSAEQAAPIARLIKAVKARSPDALYVCDPVIGDRGGLYVPQATAEAIRDHLLPLADIATPNRAELDWLAGRPSETLEEIAAATRSLPPPAMLVTSAPAGEGRIGNLWVEEETALLASHDLVAKPPNGLGDLTAAMLLAQRLEGKAAGEAVRHVTAAVFDILSRAAERGADELMLETDATSLRSPTSKIHIKRVCANAEASRRTLVGVDGCKKGWIGTSRNPDGKLTCHVEETFAGLVAHYPDDSIIVVDIPMGLPNSIGVNGRGPEGAIRPLLGRRRNSVFDVPSRPAIEAIRNHPKKIDEWPAAHELLNKVARETSDPPKGVSRQLLALIPKIQEVDAVLQIHTSLRSRIVESHPEIAFWRLNDEKPMAFSKKTKGRISPRGMLERRRVLEANGLDGKFLDAPCPKGASRDDFLDACAMLHVAERYARGEALSFPNPPLVDSHGIPIAIWT